MAITQIQQRNKVYDYATYKTSIPAAGEFVAISGSSATDETITEVIGDGVSTVDELLVLKYGNMLTAAQKSYIPTADEKDALAGFTTPPSSTNKYITESEVKPSVYLETGDTASAATSGGNIVWASKSSDSLNILNLTTGEITIPVSGIYEIAFGAILSNVAEAERFEVSINNVVSGIVVAYNPSSSFAGIAGTPNKITLTAGQTVKVVRLLNSGARTYTRARTTFTRIGD